MTDDLERRAQEIQDAATDEGGEGTPALSTVEILGYLGEQFAQFADITTVENLPADAHIRANGYFDDPLAFQDYLEQGGLITYDDEGNPVKTGLVYVVEETDEVDGSLYYQVYITDNSPTAT
jgi:hypothetical protein